MLRPLEKHLMDIIGFMRQIMKHTLITLLVAIAITACSPFTPAPTAITLPSPTIASTQTPVPTFTVTLTPAPAAGEIKLMPFTVETQAQLIANGIDVAKWTEANGGKVITPGDLIDGIPSVERKYPSKPSTKVTGFWSTKEISPDGSESVFITVNEKAELDKLPLIYDWVYLNNADGIAQDAFDIIHRLPGGANVHGLMGGIMRMDTVGGELELVMMTMGEILDSPPRAQKLDDIAGLNFVTPAMPLVKNRLDTNNTADTFGSRLAGEIMELNAIKIKEVGDLLVSTDLRDPAAFKILQEELRKVWFGMDFIPELKYLKVQG
jgi:hypothetical protein